MKRSRIRIPSLCAALGVLLLIAVTPTPARAQDPSTNLGGYGLKIFRVESGLYPFVQVYLRTFDQEKNPLVNLNELNIGVMVKGRSYDPAKRQYRVESIRNRQEAIRSILVLDASESMLRGPWQASIRAIVRYIDSKRPQDEIAILVIRDTKEGYELVSNFERDAGALGRRLADLSCDGKRTRLYDTIGAAMQLSGMVSQGANTGIGDTQYVASTSIVVFSDGKDEGSALSREELNARITALPIPIPIYSVAYTTIGREYFKNLESLSKNSFGVYYDLDTAVERMQRTVENIQNILQNDYVVTLRSYVPVDGEEHAVKIGVEYPSRSGRVTYESARFEALEPPPIEAIISRQKMLAGLIPETPDRSPYIDTKAGPAAEAAGAQSGS